MSELPEVETSRCSTKPHLMGTTIMYATVRNGRLRQPVSEGIYRLSDQPVLSVQRHAKYPLLRLADGWTIVHLGMPGSLRILPEEPPADKHDHADLVMSNGRVLRYTDPRRFGARLWTKKLDRHNVLAHLDPEPLSGDFNANYPQQKCMERRTAIKPRLTNNKLVVGVGNIYASELLFTTGIHPDRFTSSLLKDECELLIRVIKAVSLRPTGQGRITLKDFLQSDGRPGYFAQELQIYGRESEPCRVCDAPIVATKHAQRIASYCHRCRKQLHYWPDVAFGQVHYFSLLINIWWTLSGKKCATSP